MDDSWSIPENWAGSPLLGPDNDGTASIVFSSTADAGSFVLSTIDAPWHIQGISLSGVNDMTFEFSGEELTVGSGGFSQTPLSGIDPEYPYALAIFNNNLKLSAPASFHSGDWELMGSLDIGEHTLTIGSEADVFSAGAISGTGKFVVEGFWSLAGELNVTPSGATADFITLDGGTLDLSWNSANPVTADMGITLGAGGGTLMGSLSDPDDLDLSVLDITGTGDLTLIGKFNSDSFLPGHTGDTILGGDGCGCDAFPATWTVGDTRPALPPGRITISDSAFGPSVLELRGHSFTLTEGILGSGFVTLGGNFFDAPLDPPIPGATLTLNISGTSLHTANVLPSDFVGMADLEDFDDQGSVVKTGAGTLQLGASFMGAKFDLQAGSVDLVDPLESSLAMTPPGQVLFLSGVDMAAGTTFDLNDISANIGGPQGGLNGAAGSLIKIGNPISEVDFLGDPLPNLMITAESAFAGNIVNDDGVATSGKVLISAPPDAVVTFSGVNTYNGGTTVESGILQVTGTMVSPITLFGCDCEAGVLTGNGQVGGLTIEEGGRVAPGNSAGTLTVAGDSAWNNGGAYELEIEETAGAAGVNWDLLLITGALDLSGLDTGEFAIEFSLLNPGEEFNFGDEWTFATATGGITGFEADDFVVNDNGFADSLGGKFGVIQDGDNLNLAFTAVPEPSDYAAAFGLGLLGFAAWRRRRQAAARPALV